MSSSEPAADIVIIGCGVIGLSCAYFLQQLGHRVTLVDRGTVGCGASHGNCGMISPSHAAPLAVPGLIPQALRWMWQPDAPLYIKPTLNMRRLAWLVKFARRCNWKDYWTSAHAKHALLSRSRVLFDQIIGNEQLNCEFAAVGHLCVYREHRAFAEAQQSIETWKTLGIAVEKLDGDQARALEPALNDQIVGALLTPQDAHLRPDRYVAELARVVVARGALLRLNTDVYGFEYEDSRVTALRTSGGRIAAQRVLLATGAWSPELGGQLGMRLPIEPAKGYSITMSRPALTPTRSIVFRERGVAVTPWPSGYRLGSTYEFSGFDKSLNPIRFNALRRAAGEYLRDPLGEFIEEEWVGFRPMTPDGLPVMQLAPALSNAWVAAGHGTLGMSMSPATGERMAELIGPPG
jgi:D-amino-acid dehydrogenase